MSIFGTHNANKSEFAEALAFAAEHNIHPIIAQKLTLERATEGHRLLEAGRIFGKISLQHWE